MRPPDAAREPMAGRGPSGHAGPVGTPGVVATVSTDDADLSGGSGRRVYSRGRDAPHDRSDPPDPATARGVRRVLPVLAVNKANPIPRPDAPGPATALGIRRVSPVHAVNKANPNPAAPDRAISR